MNYKTQIQQEIDKYFDKAKIEGLNLTRDQVIKAMALSLPYKLRDKFRKLAYE